MKQSKSAPQSPEAFIAQLDESRRTEIRQVDELIRKAVPAFEPHLESGMLAYGRYHYRYGSGREGDWCRVALAPTKAGISLYVAAADENGYLAEQAAGRLGKVSVGKSCIRFRKFADLNVPEVVALLRRAAEVGGAGEIKP